MNTLQASKNIEQVVKWKWGVVCNCKYYPQENTWEIFNWESSEISQPTNSEIESAITEYQAVLDAKQYQRDRQYPSIEEQLDMQYWDSVNGTTVWADTIAAVKAANPKPE